MAGRNRNTFFMRQKEMKRVQKAWQKMARRHGRGASEDGRDAEERSPGTETLGAYLAASMNARNPEAQV